MERRQDTTRLYSVMQGLYWMIFCAYIGFATVYLLSQGRSASDIGILIAVSNITGALLQPVAAELSDRTERLSLSQMVILLAGAGALVSFVLLKTDGFLTIILYGALVALVHVIMPLMNALGMAYNNDGQCCNFGLARAMGSLGFAVISYVLGILVDRYGAWTIPITAGGLFLLLALVMALGQEPLWGDRDPTPVQGIRKGSSVMALMTGYSGFLYVLAGVFLIYGFHNITNIYLIQIMETVGGSAREMGITIGLAAVLELPAMIFFTRIHKKLGSAGVLKLASVFWVVKSLGYLLAGRVGHIYATQLFQALAFAPFTPGVVYYTDELMADRDKVRGQAYMATANTLGGVLGSLSGGFFLDLSGVRTMILFGVGLAVTGAMAVIRGVRGRRSQAPAI